MTESRQPRDLGEVPDESLMDRYRNGDSEAFEELFARYEPRAYAFFLRRTGTPERAQDLYQELFLRIHRARDQYDSQRLFAPWFFQIANRLLVDDWRRAFRSHEVAIEDREARSLGADSEECVAQRELCGQALEALSADERYVIIGGKVEGISYSELAEHLGKSVDAIKKLASRASKRLRASALADMAL